MKRPVVIARQLGILAALLLVASEAGAQRAYQKFWQKHYEELKKEPVTVIEDNAAERNLEDERYVFPDPLRQIIVTAFPGTTGILPEEDEKAAKTFSAYSRGAMGLEIGSPAPALKGFEEALEADPANPLLKLRLAQAAMMVNDLSRAQVLLEELVADDPQNFRALLQLGDLALMRQRFPEARKAFEQVLTVKPRNIQALESLCQISYEFYQDLDATKDYSQRILLIDDSNPQAMLWQAEACAFTGDATRAAEYYARLISTRPNLVDRVAEVGRRLTAVGKPQDARILYERAVLANPMHAELRRAWESAVRVTDGEAGVRAAWKKLAEESKGDLRIYDLYCDYLKRTKAWDELVATRLQILAQQPGHVPSLMELAEHELRRNDFAAAEKYLQRAITEKTAEPSVIRRAGLAYLDHGDYARAGELLRRALALDERDVQSLDALALLAAREGKPEEAEKLLRDGLRVAPANAYLLGRLATHYLELGKKREARELFQQVLAANPDDVETWLILAGLYYEENDWNNLQILDGEITKRLGNNSRFHSAFGEMAMSWGDFDRARSSLERAVLLAPGDLRSRVFLSQTYLQLDEKERAVDVLSKADKSIPTPELLRQRDLALADTFTDLHEHAKAQAIYDELLKRDGEDFVALEGRLIAIVRQDRADEARKELNDIVRKNQGDVTGKLWRLRAAVLRELGEYDRARDVLREARKMDPKNYDIVFQLAQVAGDDGRIDDAEAHYRELLALGPAPNNPWYETAANNLGYLFATKGIKLDEAEKLILEALALNPRAPHILDSLGVVYLKKGDLSKAREYLERAARFSIRDGEVCSNLGQLYEKIGEREQARRMYDKALEFDPRLKSAKDRLDALADTPPSTAPAKQ